MKLRGSINLSILIPLFIVMLFSTTLAAQSFPQPGNDENVSLLGIYFQTVPDIGTEELKGNISLHINGPKTIRLRIGKSDWGVLWFKVDPGLYSLIPEEGLDISPDIPDSIQIPPASVVLAPFLLERSAAGVTTGRLNEEVRQISGRDLTLQINHPQWMGRNLIGFGTLRPALDPETLQFKVDISVEPEGAEIYVDDVLAGTAPLMFSLTGGKHRVLIRNKGYEDAVYYVRLEGDALIDAILNPSETDLKENGKERYSTLVAPFVSLGEQNDQLARLFADTLLLTLENDSRLDVKPSSVPWLQRDAVIHPDFRPLEEVGADLIVSGFFTEKENKLGIQANLYDVQAETIRAAVTWYGSSGLDIFDAMDEISVDFAREVDRVLPAAGRTLITRQETVFSGVNRSESLLARKKIIRRRWENHPNTFAIQGGFGGTMTSFTLNDNGSTQEVGSSEGPNLQATLSWDRDINEHFALGTGFALASRSVRYNHIIDDISTSWVGTIFAGPRLVFRSLRADIIIGIDIRLRYTPQDTFYWFDGVNRQADLGSFLSIELPLNVGFRYYFNNRIDAVPVFLSGGLVINPLGYRFDLGGTGHAGMSYTSILLNLGMGMRL